MDIMFFLTKGFFQELNEVSFRKLFGFAKLSAIHRMRKKR